MFRSIARRVMNRCTYNKEEACNLADASTRLRAPFNRFTRIRRAVMQSITDTDIFMLSGMCKQLIIIWRFKCKDYLLFFPGKRQFQNTLSKACTVLLNSLFGIQLWKCPSPTPCHWNRNSAVGTEISYGLGETGFIWRQAQKIFSSPKPPVSWVPVIIRADRAAWGVKVTAHLI